VDLLGQTLKYWLRIKPSNQKPMPTIFQRMISRSLIATLLFTSLTPGVFASSYDYDEGFYDQGFEIYTQQMNYQNGKTKESSYGAFNFSLPITTPPGRNGLEAQVELSYNSQASDKNNIMGYGWSMNLPSIKRINRTGVDKLYTQEYFSSSLDGELVNANPSSGSYGDYEAKIENGSFMSYEYNSSGYWLAQDKNGKTYTFGSTQKTRQDNPSNSTQVYQWMIEEIRDANDNYIKFEYSKDSGQIYPDMITYTGHGSDDGIFTVEFDLEARTDTHLSYATGFPVETNSRISDINVSVDGIWIHKYELEYTTGDNGYRSLLNSVTQSVQNQDGTQFQLPANEFTYETSTKTWTENEDYNMPVYFRYEGESRYKGLEILDVNGDGGLDFVNSGYYGSDYKKVYINNLDDTGWTEDTSYNIPSYFWSSSGNNIKKVRSADVNGDGFNDLIESYVGSGADYNEYVYINNTDDTGWTEDSNYNMPVAFHKDGSGDQGVRILDVNGDGLVDMLESDPHQNNVYINNGDGLGWTLDSNYSIPVTFYWDNSISYKGVKIADVNGDGLIDFIESRYSGTPVKKVYINQGDGTGWIEDSNYSIPLYFWSSSNSDVENVFIADLNGDELPDLIQSNTNGGTIQEYAYINKGDGTGWTLDNSYNIPVYFHNGSSSSDKGVRMIDVNADGMMDFVESNKNSSGVYINDSKPTDRLITIDHSSGSNTQINYENSSSYDNPDLPLLIDVVSSITTEDGLGESSTVTYDYSDGQYNYEHEYERNFAGFGHITKTEENRSTVSYYHNGTDSDISLIGRKYKQEIYDSLDQLVQRSWDNWTHTDLGNDNDFVYLTDQIIMSYDGQSSHVDKATSYDYDTSTGNLLEKIEWGEVSADTDGNYIDISGDDRTTSYTYVTTTLFEGLIASQTLYDENSNQVSLTEYYYDELGPEEADHGNLTKSTEWLDESSSYIENNYHVNAYGLNELIIDPNGNATTITYDSAYLYPEYIENAMGHVTYREYDYASGQVSLEMNANGYTSEYEYDGLGRPLSISVPNEHGITSLLTEISYDDTSIPSSSTTETTVDGVTVESRSYKDGFGRVIQEWIPTENSTPTLIDTWYNKQGEVETQSLPYSSSSSSYAGRDSSQESTSYTYDALGRIIVKTSPIGNTYNDYEHWTHTTTDPNGIDKSYTYNAFGSLIEVNEENEGSTYTSEYDYNTLGLLTQLTDAQGNIRNFDYDSLGRLTSQDDLHDPSSSVQAWLYTYDDNGNRLSQSNPSSQIISWTYDPLNRLVSEDWDDDGSDEFIYTYDGSSNGIGYLEKIHGDDFDFHYEYDAQGNVFSESKTIDGESFTTETNYDLLGRPSKVLYPHGAMEVDYIYNSAGQIESISRNNGESIVDNIDYSPTGQISLLEFANGNTTTNTYDATEAYRLTSKVTTNSDGNIQDLSYSYDNNGNITSIIDNSITSTNKTLTYSYDDLNRLTAASSSGFTDGDYSLSYEYDSIGNMTYKSDLGSMEYNGMHPQAVTNVDGMEYHYDANGNLVSNGEKEFHWNIKNQLEHGDPWIYSYDHSGQRIMSDSGSRRNLYVNAYLELIDGIANYYIFADSVRIASISEGETPQYIHQDHLGGTALVTSESGELFETKDYYPYGSELLSESTTGIESTHTFTDKEYEEDLGLYYFEARWMNPALGSFVSLDPAQYDERVFTYTNDPQSFQSYAYARNNPIIMVDPYGEEWYQLGTWDTNWETVVIGATEVTMGITEVRSGVLVGLGTGGLASGIYSYTAITGGSATVAVGTANIINGFSSSESEPIGIEVFTGGGLTFDVNTLEEITEGVNNNINELNTKNSTEIKYEEKSNKTNLLESKHTDPNNSSKNNHNE